MNMIPLIGAIAGSRRRTSAVTYDFEENFETPTTGYDNSGWTTYGSANPAYSTSPAPLQGTQSLYAATGALRGSYRSHTAWTGEKWFYWRMYCVTAVVNDYHFYADLVETSFRIGFSSGKIRLWVGGVIVDAASAFPLDQLVHVWVRYQPGAAGTANGDLYYSTDGVRGTPKCSVTTATTTTEANRPWWLSRSTYAVIWDRIIINSTAIGDNP